jgi:NADH-quinone oxidoreductase subunit K
MLFVYLSFIVFVISLLGVVFNFQNVLILLMGIEILLLSTNLNFIFFSLYLDDLYGQLFSLFILTIAASESAIGLAIIISHYRSRGNILLNDVTLLKG